MIIILFSVAFFLSVSRSVRKVLPKIIDEWKTTICRTGIPEGELTRFKKKDKKLMSKFNATLY